MYSATNESAQQVFSLENLNPGYCVSCWVGLALDSSTLNVNIHFSAPTLGGVST